MNDGQAPDGVRLAKRVAALAGCSRSEAEMLIAQGAVTVDGLPAAQPQQRVTPQQRVDVAAGARPQPLAPATLLLHKPAGLPCDAADLWARVQRDADDARRGRPAVPGLFAGQRCVAPLAESAGGLVVFTQVPGVARRLLDAAEPVEHEFSIEVEGAVDASRLQALQPARASIGHQSPERTGLRLVLPAPQAMQVEALCARAGLTLLALKRLRIGRLPLAGLAAGQWRVLRPQERF